MKKGRPLLVATTCWTGPMIKDVVYSLKLAKASSNIPTVIGGIHPSLLPEETIKSPYIDYLIKGEGEKSFYELVRVLKYGGSLASIPSLYFKEDGKIIFTGDLTTPLNLDDLPALPYQLVDVNEYMPLYEGRRSFSFESSRGCPFSCRYCYQGPFSNSRIRYISASRVIERIKHIKERYRPDDIYFIDDNFFIDLERGRGREIAESFLKMGLTYQVQGVDILSLMKMDSSYLRLLEKSGLRRITIGIETGSPELRRYLGKKGEVKDIIDVVKKLSEFKIIVYCSFFGGYPKECIEDIRKSIDLIFNLMEINPNFRCSPYYLYIPFPGTPMYNEIIQSGIFKPPSNFEEWGDFSWEDNPYINAMGSDRREMYQRLYLLTLFVDNKFKEYETSSIIKLISRVYGYVSKARLKKLFLRYMPEMVIYKYILR